MTSAIRLPRFPGLARRAAPVAGLIWSLSLGSALAQETTLRAVNAFDPGTRLARNFERFIEKVNTEGKGLVHIQYIGGGAKVMHPFELGNAVRTAVVDIVNVPGSYYTNLVPEADALKLTRRTMPELRQNGGWAYLNRLHNEKMNAQLLARTGDGVTFHLYLNRKLDKPDLHGLKLRVTPTYAAFFSALGATPLRTPPGEVYTALERGVVDGYGFAMQGLFDLGLQEVTKYRVDPGFYSVDVNVLVNLDKYKGLRDDQRAFLDHAALWLESLDRENSRINLEEAERQAASGIERITLRPEDAARYLQTAEDAGWQQIKEVSPEHANRLHALFTR